MKRTYILAANYQHFRTCCRNLGLNPNSPDVRYVADVWTLRGLDSSNEFIYYETWNEHPQAQELDWLVNLAKSIPPYVP